MSSSNRKRSVSPQSVDNNALGSSSRLKRLFHYFTSERSSDGAQDLSKLNYKIGPLTLDQGNEKLPGDDVGPNDVIFDKRRRISMHQASESKGYIPRSSVDFRNSQSSKYNSYLHKLQEEEEEKNNNIETRATSFAVDVSQDGEYDSPIPDIQDVRKKSVQLVNGLINPSKKNQRALQRLSNNGDDYHDQDEEEVYGSGEEEVEEFDENGYPIVIEHEFAPLYTDEDGNLVRPPFINLAPRERYQLLQLKRSIETSQALQSRLKYMVNPNETNSIKHENGTKVETSTQTYDIHYLRNKLHFNNYIRRKVDNPKNKPDAGAMFSGEFFYDVDSQKDNKPENQKLSGYLGTVSKPKFKQDSQVDHFTDASNIKLDSDYISKTKNVSDIIKLKESKSNNKLTLEPSSGFKFSINKDEINDLIRKRNEGDDLVEQSKLNRENEPPSLNFELKEKSNKKAPKSDAPVVNASSEKEKLISNGKSAFLFGSTEKKETPKFNFGVSSSALENDSVSNKPKFSLGNENNNTNEVNKPAFTFGNKEGEPSLSFDILRKENDEDEPARKRQMSQPSGKKTDALKFSFGASSNKKDGTPKFSFGSSTERKDDAPKFSFGSSTEKKDEIPKLPTSSGSEKEAEPKFSFGATTNKEESTSTFSLGKTPDSKNEKPKFSFRASAPEKKENIPALILGGEGEKKGEGSSPKFSFGSNTEQKEGTPFSLGGSTAGSSGTEKKEATPQFTFGESSAAKNDSSKPAFNFGSTQKPASDTERKSPFNFGATEKPTFNFGAVEKPSFNFTPSNNNVNTGFSNPAPNVSASVPPPSKSPFQFGAVEKPKLQTESPFAKQGSPPINGVGNTGGLTGSGNNSFQFANGITPVKPGMQMNKQFGFNKEGTPNTFTSSRSNTPDFSGTNPGIPGMNQGMPGMNSSMLGMSQGMPGMNQGMAGFNQAMPGMSPGMPGMNPGMPGMNPGMPGMNPSMPGMNPGMSGAMPGMNMGMSPMGNPNVNRPNRKIAQIRRRRG